MKKAYLLLADGTLFEGTAVGYEGQSIGEVVFNTGMAGYQEVLTDPSYYGQVVTMTYPLVGNYGINFEDYESRKSWVSGFIMREMCEYPSNWRCKVTLDEYLKAQKVVGLAGIDTRRLTRKLRGEGVMNGVIYTEGFEPDEQTIAEMKAYVVKDAVKTVTCDENIVYPADGETKYRIALFDYGVKYNIERELCKRGCEVTVVPAYTKPEDVVGKYDGVMLSNGPGDPAENVEIVANLKELLKEREQATAAKLKQLNSKVQAELDAAVTSVPGTISIDSSGGWFPSYTMQNTFTLNNISAKTITGLQGSVEVFDNDGMLLQRCRFNDYLTLAPQGSSSLKKLFSLNQFKPETVRLLRSDLKTVKWQVTISSVSFDDGSQLQLLTQLPKAK